MFLAHRYGISAVKSKSISLYFSDHVKIYAETMVTPYKIIRKLFSNIGKLHTAYSMDNSIIHAINTYFSGLIFKICHFIQRDAYDIILGVAYTKIICFFDTVFEYMYNAFYIFFSEGLVYEAYG